MEFVTVGIEATKTRLTAALSARKICLSSVAGELFGCIKE